MGNKNVLSLLRSEMHIDLLDHLLLVREIWFLLTFEHYVVMSKVSRRWRRLYIAVRDYAKARYLHVSRDPSLFYDADMLGSFGDWSGTFYIDAAGESRLHGDTVDLYNGNRWPHGETIVAPYYFGKRGGWLHYICDRCNKLKCAIYRPGNVLCLHRPGNVISLYRHHDHSDDDWRDTVFGKLRIESDQYYTRVAYAVGSSQTIEEIYERTAHLAEICAANGLDDLPLFVDAYLSQLGIRDGRVIDNAPARAFEPSDLPRAVHAGLPGAGYTEMLNAIADCGQLVCNHAPVAFPPECLAAKEGHAFAAIAARKLLEARQALAKWLALHVLSIRSE